MKNIFLLFLFLFSFNFLFFLNNSYASDSDKLEKIEKVIKENKDLIVIIKQVFITLKNFTIAVFNLVISLLQKFAKKEKNAESIISLFRQI